MKRVMALLFLWCVLLGSVAAQEEASTLKDLARSNVLTDLQIEPTQKGIADGKKNLMQRGREILNNQMKKALQSGMTILTICGVCAVATALAKAGNLPMTDKAVELAGICLLILAVYSDTKNLLSESQRAVEEIGVFAKILLPTFATWGAAAGKPLSTMALAGGAMVYTDVLCSVGVKWFFPMVLLYIFLSMAGHIGANRMTQGIAAAMRSGLFWIVKLCLWGITFYLTISGAVTIGSDSLAVKTAKAFSGVVPVVGSAIANAAESVLTGAGAMRNTVGAVGIIGLLGVVLLPFIRLGIYMVIFRCAAVLATSVATSGMAKCIEAIAAGYAMAMGLLAAACGGVIMALILAISVFGAV